MGWRVCEDPECSLPLLGFCLAASDQLAGQSWWGKRSWEKLPCEALLRCFHGRPSSLSWELLEVTALSCLAAAWAALWPCPCQAGVLLMGALTLPQALNFPSEPQACLFALGVAAPCCGFIVPARMGWGTCPAMELCCSREWWMISLLLQENWIGRNHWGWHPRLPWDSNSTPPCKRAATA